MDGTRLTDLAYRKSLALLYYLAVTGRSHSRDWLVGLLWAESTQANARASLRKVLAELRRQLPAYLLITRDEVAFNRQAPYWLDVEALQQRLSILQHTTMAAEEAAEVAEVVQLYRGLFLEGFGVHRAPGFEEWALLQREGIRLAVLQALDRLADHGARAGDYQQALQYVTRALALEPAQEEAHQLLMTLLAVTGKRHAALRQYQVCRRALREHLGTQPGSDTLALYRRIRAGARLTAPSWAARHNLPMPLTPLIGREAELARISECLRDPSCRLLSLVGPGGSGKTRLALEAVAAQRGQFEHGVYYVPLAPPQSVQSLAAAIAQAVGLVFRQASRAEQLRQQLLPYLRSRHVLLLLDGLEDLLALAEPAEDGTRLLADMLQAAPGIKVMVTSRSRLNLEGELVMHLGGLKVPPLETGSGAEQYAAVQLFVTAARRVRPDFRPTDDDLADVARICRLLDGLPLCILLAAGWMGMLTPSEIAARISGTTSQPLDFLWAEWRDAPPRQCSMRTVLEHSYQLLTEKEQSTLRGLSVFRGGFSEGAAREVSGASLRVLRALVDKSRLRRNPAGRYELHALVRQHALEKLRASPDGGESLRNRHSAFFASALHNWWADLQASQQARALAEMRADAENLSLAWEWAAEHPQVAQLDRSMDGLCTFYEWTGRYTQAESACQRAHEALSAKPQSPGDLRVQARALAWQGVFTHALGRAKPAEELLQRSLSMLESPGLAGQDTRLARAFGLWRMGNVALEASATHAMRLYQQSQALYQAQGDRWGLASVAEALGQAATRLGYHSAAKQAYAQSLALYRGLGDQRGMLGALRRLADAAGDGERGEEPEAGPWESGGPLEETDPRGAVASLLQEVGSAMSMGRYVEAQDLLEQELAAQKTTNDSTSNGLLSLAKAVIHLHLGRYGEAQVAAQHCLTLCKAAGCQWAIEVCCGVLGLIALALGACGEAEDWLEQSVAICRKIRAWDDLGLGQAYLAIAAQGQGKLAQASEQLGEALRMGVSTQGRTLQLLAVQAMALLLAAQGAQERAVELQALVLRYPAVANSQWCRDVCTRHIAAAEAALPSPVLEAAQARGRGRDLRATVAELLTALDPAAGCLPRERCEA